MGVLDRNQIVKGISRLGELAFERGLTIELLVVGGAVMVLDFQSRGSTKDMDAVSFNSVDPATLRSLATNVAVEMQWPSDWLNDGAKGYIVGSSEVTVLFESKGIKLFRPSYQ